MSVAVQPLGRRLMEGALWSLLGAFFSRGLSVVTFALAGRILSREGLGELGILQTTVILFGTLAGLGMGLSATKYVAELRNSDRKRAGDVIALTTAATWSAGALFAVLLFAIAPAIASETLASPRLTNPLRTASLLLLLNAVSGAQAGILAGFEAFRATARINCISGILTFVLVCAGAKWGGVQGAMLGFTVATAFLCFINHLEVRKQCQTHAIEPTLTGCLAEWRMLVSFNLPAMLTAIAHSASSWLGGAMLTRQQDGYSDLGLYYAALRIKQVPESVLAVIVAPMIPVLSDSVARKDAAAAEKTVSFNFSISWLLMIPISLLQAAVPALTLLPYGREYHGSPLVVQWLMLHGLAYALLWPIGILLASVGKMWHQFAINVAFSLIYLAASYRLVPSLGAIGLSFSLALAYILSNAVSVLLLHRELPSVMKAVQWRAGAALTVTLFVACWAGSRFGTGVISVSTGLAAAIVFVCWVAIAQKEVIGQILRYAAGRLGLRPALAAGAVKPQ